MSLNDRLSKSQSRPAAVAAMLIGCLSMVGALTTTRSGVPASAADPPTHSAAGTPVDSAGATPHITDRQLEFFESRIRPVLVEACYHCHNSAETHEGGLALDHRAAILRGADSGPIVVVGKPESSKLIAVLKHQIEGLEMPEDGPKLDQETIADFERWIRIGLPDPRSTAPSAQEVETATSWKAKLAHRKQWWSFQPVAHVNPPAGDGHPVDRFIKNQLDQNGLTMADPASPHVLIRRLFLTLHGLPPTPEQIRAWTARFETDGRQTATDELIDHLLENPRFGERWARHWMDWIRYAESHGSEGDPRIDRAWMYRDYLIRALNDDIPYDQLVREHIAGDLLDAPRINAELGLNESLIAPAHWRMVFHGFAPTDALDEKVRFVDDQINAFSKAFLGITVSCARCHDHKFDAISQADYYALFGILGSCRPGRNVVDVESKQRMHHAELSQLKTQIRNALADDWRDSLAEFAQRFHALEIDQNQTAKNIESILSPVARIRGRSDSETVAEVWEDMLAESGQQERDESSIHAWDLSRHEDLSQWYCHGVGLEAEPSQAGQFAVAPEGDRALMGVYPAGVFSHGLSTKSPARLTSPDIHLDQPSDVWARVIGGGKSMIRYVVQDYPRNGTVYPVRDVPSQWTWIKFPLAYWQGDDIHLELANAMDAPLLVKNNPRSWFGVSEIRITPKDQGKPESEPFYLDAIVSDGDVPATMQEVMSRYRAATAAAIERWQSGNASDADARWIDQCLQLGLLPNQIDSLPTAAGSIKRYRQLENAIPVPTRVPGLDETRGRQQHLFIRGNHKKPGPIVPRRFLEAIDPTPYQTAQSGRLELANDVLRPDNPLTRRVIVNRVWHHLFGHGIVRSPDNFGKLGQLPTHPELLDWLATHFSDEGWSIKRLIRTIVTSRTWQQSSTPSPRAEQIDPDNRYLSHADVRRLEAEAIRDSLLMVGGELDLQSFGPSVAGTTNRRSVYVQVIRNKLDPMLRTFDFPEPFSTTGRRDHTNVPAQSLMMMNDPQVIDYAESFSQRLLADASVTSDVERLRKAFLILLGRPATKPEIEQCETYLQTTIDHLVQRREMTDRLTRQIADAESRIEAILSPVRKRLSAERATTAPSPTPKPISAWEFDSDLKDSVGSAHGIAHRGAHVQNGGLIVRKGGYVTTAPIDHTITEKTLEAWVQLDNLRQRGGGVMSIELPEPSVFDAIVFAEREPGRWMAGSNFFERTADFGGPVETEADQQPVHIAIVYQADGQISAYRNGVPYGRSYQSVGPVKFRAGEAIVNFGVRHLPATGNRLLQGRIEKARLYDVALTPEQIAEHASHDRITLTDVIAALDQAGLQTLRAEEQRITKLQSQLDVIGPPSSDDPHKDAWNDLAKGMMTLKEFIYVR